jgi:hypothetical protein
MMRTRPRQPVRLIALTRRRNVLKAAVRQAGLTGDVLEQTLLGADLADATTELEDYLIGPEHQDYLRAVEEHESWVESQREVDTGLVQAARHDRAVIRVRAAACPRCFATHAGEC